MSDVKIGILPGRSTRGGGNLSTKFSNVTVVRPLSSTECQTLLATITYQKKSNVAFVLMELKQSVSWVGSFGLVCARVQSVYVLIPPQGTISALI